MDRAAVNMFLFFTYLFLSKGALFDSFFPKIEKKVDGRAKYVGSGANRKLIYYLVSPNVEARLRFCIC